MLREKADGCGRGNNNHTCLYGYVVANSGGSIDARTSPVTLSMSRERVLFKNGVLMATSSCVIWIENNAISLPGSNKTHELEKYRKTKISVFSKDSADSPDYKIMLLYIDGALVEKIKIKKGTI